MTVGGDSWNIAGSVIEEDDSGWKFKEEGWVPYDERYLKEDFASDVSPYQIKKFEKGDLIITENGESGIYVRSTNTHGAYVHVIVIYDEEMVVKDSYIKRK